MADGLSDVIGRKEYEERHTALQLQLQGLLASVQANAKAVSELAANVAKNAETVATLTTQMAVIRDRAKWLYPLVGGLVSLITFLLGLHVGSAILP